MMAKTFECDGVVYGPAEAVELRCMIIQLRDIALKNENFDWAVELSHLIALMAMMGEEIWGGAMEFSYERMKRRQRERFIAASNEFLDKLVNSKLCARHKCDVAYLFGAVANEYSYEKCLPTFEALLDKLAAADRPDR